MIAVIMQFLLPILFGYLERKAYVTADNALVAWARNKWLRDVGAEEPPGFADEMASGDQGSGNDFSIFRHRRED